MSLTRCSCETSSSTNRCKCKKCLLKCTDARKCTDGQNIAQEENVQSLSDQQYKSDNDEEI